MRAATVIRVDGPVILGRHPVAACSPNPAASPAASTRSAAAARAQLYTGRCPTDTVFGLFAGIRTAKNGPSGKERCGRAGINSKQNQGAFHDLPVKNRRLLDGDGCFVTNPGYGHCEGVAQICVWRKIS
ncbi:hypothetical protein [Streptomyces sp. NPDC007905]|uniref:hypothetical protein n=1 Tax=Streptomyces sp. NPDC007905 TaxID=3364788 RepID=UPI0036E604B6